MAKEIRVDWRSLREFTKEVFVRAGLPPEDAATEAEVLIWANLRGVDSHGVLRIPSYVQNVDTGQMNPRPNIRIEKETAATLLIEGDRAFGPVVTVYAMERAISKAKEAGICWALIRNTTHQGAMGYYALMAAKQNMAGIALVCSPPNMAPYGARAPGVHNSPIAIAVPAKKHRPLILDMATSVAARGKIDLAIDKGIHIPHGWALTGDGQPTTDPTVAKILMPAGSYKGSGLALMFECLSSVMAGNPLLSPVLTEKVSPSHIQNGIVAAIDISTFTDVEEYREHIDQVISGIKALPKAEGTDEMMVPGEPEDKVYEDRVRSGVPLPEGTVTRLRSVAERFGVQLPAELQLAQPIP